MWLNLHAIVLLLIPVATVVAVVTLKRRSPTARQALFAAVVSLVTVIAATLGIFHACHEGVAHTQWSIPAICILVVLLYVRSAAWRRGLALTMAIAAVALSQHFTAAVHWPGWTGNPDWPGVGETLLHTYRRSAEQDAAKLDDPHVVYEAGWYFDLPHVAETWARMTGWHPRGEVREMRRVWHTWLTGLYAYDATPVDIWYPGGPFLETIPNMELRERPRPR